MFPSGISGNHCGRPRGSSSGRTQVLAALSRMLSQECNQQAIFDALDDWLPIDRHPQSPPPPGLYSPPTPPPLPSTPGKESPSGIPGLQPSSLTIADCPLPIAPVSQILTPHSSILSLTCYLLLLIPFALKPDQVPHPARTLVQHPPPPFNWEMFQVEATRKYALRRGEPDNPPRRSPPSDARGRLTDSDDSDEGPFFPCMERVNV